MYIDSQGLKVDTSRTYSLDLPNPWGKKVRGGVQWMINVARKERPSTTGYHFVPYDPEDKQVVRSSKLEFTAIPDAPMVKMCVNLIPMRLKRDKTGQWVWIERGEKL